MISTSMKKDRKNPRRGRWSMRKIGFNFTHLLDHTAGSTTGIRGATMCLASHCRLVVCKKIRRILSPSGWCPFFFAVSFCFYALRASRRLIIEKPPAGWQPAIVQPFYFNRPPAGWLMAVASLVRPSVALVGAHRLIKTLLSVMHLRCEMLNRCLVAVFVDGLRSSPGHVHSNEVSTVFKY